MSARTASAINSAAPGSSGASVNRRIVEPLAAVHSRNSCRSGFRTLADLCVPRFVGLMKGPSRCIPIARAPSNVPPISFPILSTADDRTSAEEETVVGRNEVVPWRTRNRLTVLSASCVPSITSTPPHPWMWGSMKPGPTIMFVASIPTAVDGALTWSAGPTSAINPFSMMRRAGEYSTCGVSSVPAWIARRLLLTTGSEVCDHFSEVTAVFSEKLLGVFAVAGQCAHHDRNFQVASGVFDQLLQLVVMEAENFAQNLHATVSEFLIGHADVDHPVAVGHAQPDHRR